MGKRPSPVSSCCSTSITIHILGMTSGAVAAEHPFRDAWWEDRNLLPLLERVEIPVYIGCDWQNVPLHLPHTSTAYEPLKKSRHLRVAMMGEHGLSWPWESLHIEALAWYDHWLNGRDTGILEGPRIRYVIPEAEGWRTSDVWPLPEAVHRAYALRADGVPSEDEGDAGSIAYVNLGGRLNRPGPSETDPSSHSVGNRSSFQRSRYPWSYGSSTGRVLHGTRHGFYRRAVRCGRKRKRCGCHWRISSCWSAQDRRSSE